MNQTPFYLLKNYLQIYSKKKLRFKRINSHQTITFSIITLLLTLPLSSIFSQEVEENVYENNLTLGKSLKVDSANNIINVGNGFNQAGYAEYLYVQKLSPVGNIIWKDSVSTGIQNNYHAATWVGTDSNDNIFVVGYQFILSQQNEFPNALKVLKYSPAGVLLVNKTITGSFGSGANYNLGNSNESFLDEDNNLYIATAGITSTQSEAGLVIIKLDNDGNTIWERVKNFSSIHALKGVSYNNGNIALVGNTAVSISENKAVVWDHNGNLLWFSNNSLPDQSWATDVLIDTNSNTYTLCQKFGTINTEIELTKYNSSGAILYRQAYNIGTESTSGRMSMLPDGSLVISGTNWSSTGTGKLFVANVTASSGAIIDSGEHLLPNINNWVYDIKVGVNGTYYIVGKSDNNGGAPATLFLYAFNNDNTLAWNTTYNTQGTIPMALDLDNNEDLYVSIQNKNSVIKFGNSIVLGTNDAEVNEILSVYPNPFSSKITIRLEKNQLPAYAIINDLSGKCLLQDHLNSYDNEIELSSLKTGVYVCRILTAENQKVIKLVKH